MSELELIDYLSRYNDWSLEDAEDGDIGYYAYADGGYLPNCYSTAVEALEAIREHYEGGE